jgi:hypothetical protein
MNSRALKIVLSAILVVSATIVNADTPIARDANGAVLGFYTAILENSGQVIVSPKGYRFVVMRETGHMLSPVDATTAFVYFEDPDCMGPAYFDRGGQYRGVIIPIRDAANYNSIAATYYVPQDAAVTPVMLTGRLQPGANGGLGCVTIPVRSIMAVPALLNDPAVTGVPNIDFIPPITVAIKGIFQDGFEA